MTEVKKQVENLVVDTTAFIQNAPIHGVAEKIITCQEVVDEVTNKRQLRRLVALPYDLIVKDVFPEHIKFITEFSKKTGDYPSLSATDIKIMALTYQLEKEKNGVEHLRTAPVIQKARVTTDNLVKEFNPDITGFFIPKTKNGEQARTTAELTNDELAKPIEESPIQLADENVADQLQSLNLQDEITENEIILIPITNPDASSELNDENNENEDDSSSDNEDDDNSDNEDDANESDDDDSGWITPSNIKEAKKQVNSQMIEEKHVAVACMTTDFAMQNVLRQINLNVSALDGRLIKQLRTYILRCYACFKTTSVMTNKFCPKCGHNTLKKVAVSLKGNGEMQIHINPRRPLTGRGKIFSLPKIKGGKHPNNPILVADQPMPDNRPSRLARTKNNPLDADYIAGFSPFVMRDVNSKSAQLRPGSEFKHWMKRNPNESKKKKK